MATVDSIIPSESLDVPVTTGRWYGKVKHSGDAHLNEFSISPNVPAPFVGGRSVDGVALLFHC